MAMEDDDDEFGDLYTDVLQPVAVTAAAPPLRPHLISLSTSTSTDPARDRDVDEKTGIPSSRGTPDASIKVILPEKVEIRRVETREMDAEEDWILGPAPIPEERPSDWNEDVENGDSKQLVSDLPKKSSSGDAKEEEPAGRVEDGGLRVKEEVVDPLSSKVSTKLSADDDIGDFNVESAIPGLSAGPVGPGAFNGMNVGATEASKSEDWDSDSGDDLQIVLNDDSVDRSGVQGNKGVGGDDDDDEDGEDDLVIVTDEDRLHHHHQSMDEREWGEESSQPAPDGEKELPDAAKGSAGVGTVPGKVGYSGHGFHPQHHSQFKYVRPGAASGMGIAASGVGGGGQIRPFTTASVAGRGRGLQRGFHPGYGAPTWGNSSSNRPPGSGLEFTLPSHKTIFEVDIDAFEEKPWKHPGVDISDFFNFELDEDTWKEYCRQLEQLRLESTMQSKIRVYESGRSEQDYDPDLPPELAAASHQDISAENANVRRVEGGQSELPGQGRGVPWIRPQLPTGRAIQVETGTIERLPTIDTRQARPRESDDAIIEIVPQGSLDDPEQPGNGGVVNAHVKGNESRSPKTQEESQELTTKTPSVHDGVNEGAGILPFPTELSNSYSKNRSFSSPLSPGGRTGRSYTGRQVVGTQPERCSDASDEYTNDAMSGQSAEIDRNGKRQRSDDNIVTDETSELLLPTTPKELSVENRDNEHDDRLDLVDSADEGEDILSYSQNSGSTHEDSNSSHSQKITSHLEQPGDLDNCDGGNSTTAPVDNTTLKLYDSVKQGEGFEVETMQDPRPGTSGDLRRHRDDNKHSFQQKNDHGRASRHEMDRSRAIHKGKEALHRSHAHRELETGSAYHIPDIDGYEKPKERGASSGIWQTRDAEIYNRRIKEGNLPIHSEETASRRRNKLRPTDRKGGAEDLHLRKQKEEGYWRNRHDRDVGSKQREGVDILITHRENLEDVHVNKRKNDETHRRDRASKEILHGHRARDDSSQSKRERADDLDHRKKDNLGRPREKAVDHLFSVHRDDNRRHRERDDRQWSKKAHEDKHGLRDREGESVARNSHILEQKSHVENEKAKDGAKGFVADKDSMHRKKRNEHPKWGGHVEIHSRNKVYQEIHAHEPQFSNEVKGYRNGRPSNHDNHSIHVSDRPPHMNREKHRSSARRSNEPEIKQNLLPRGKRKHEDSSVHQSEKANKNVQSDESVKRINGRESLVTKNDSHVDQKQEAVQEEKNPSDGEGQVSRRGRSKLERWTSHVERDCSSTTNHSLFSSLRNVEVNEDSGATQTGEPLKTEVSMPVDPDNKESGVVQASDKEECDRHLETVAKLKKRSERFKLPMPVEDTVTNKKAETEVSAVQSERLVDLEVKQERPARKRRWGGS